jgi:hypothetical protein
MVGVARVESIGCKRIETTIAIKQMYLWTASARFSTFRFSLYAALCSAVPVPTTAGLSTKHKFLRLLTQIDSFYNKHNNTYIQ